MRDCVEIEVEKKLRKYAKERLKEKNDISSGGGMQTRMREWVKR